MKKKKAGIIFILAAALLALFIPTLFGGGTAARADAYSFDLSAYDVVYDIDADCSMSVTETLTVNFTGWSSTGIMRDIPLGSGAKIENVSVTELIDGEEQSVDYDVYIEDSDYLTVDIGDYSHKSGEYTYVLRYDYIVPGQDNLLAINPIGVEWDCTIANASVTLILPDGFIAESSKCYIGEYGSSYEYAFTVTGNTVTVACALLEANNGISFDLYFEDGVLTSHLSLAPWIGLLLGVAIIIALIVLKFLKFADPPLSPIVHFEAPDGLDPLAVGQLIDGDVSDEDVTSLIYYWADKGYLKINMADEKDPVLIRVYARLPEGSPDYQVDMYNALFASGETVKISSLSQKFYPVVERVKKANKASTRSMYDKTSKTVSVIFAALGGLFAALLPVIVSMVRISTKMFDVTTFIVFVPIILIYLLTRQVYYARYRRKKSKTVLMLLGIAVLCAAVVFLYTALMPSTIMEIAPSVIAGIMSMVIVMLSVTLIKRSELYNEQLNGILGFKNFILYTEKDRLEAMLEQDPQLYYHVLPYAQVMGVTDIWENKFKALTVEPPRWMVDPLGTYVDFLVINRCLRLSFMTMNRNMVSRPQSAGGSGHRGGFSGGFGGGVGGGFGGGGGRGR